MGTLTSEDQRRRAIYFPPLSGIQSVRTNGRVIGNGWRVSCDRTFRVFSTHVSGRSSLNSCMALPIKHYDFLHSLSGPLWSNHRLLCRFGKHRRCLRRCRRTEGRRTRDCRSVCKSKRPSRNKDALTEAAQLDAEQYFKTRGGSGSAISRSLPFRLFQRRLQCARPDRQEFTLMPVHIIFQCNAHHVPESVGRKSIMRVFIDPFKKPLAEYLKSFKPKILALPGKPLDLIRRQRLRNDRINLISFP
jgi:hypothetical protein